MPLRFLYHICMALSVWCETDCGLKRTSNQDSFLINNELGLYVIADGMGGHKGGEVASSLAVQIAQEVVTESYKQNPMARPREVIDKAFREASRKIYEKSKENPELQGMGTTMVINLFKDGVLYIGNAGDSRAYLLKGKECWQLTEDHSILNEQIKAGLLSEEKAETFHAKNVITRCVGFEESVECDILEKPLLENETVLVCSDGLTGMVTDEQISNIYKEISLQQLVPTLIEEAKKNGGDDNITVMVIANNA